MPPKFGYLCLFDNPTAEDGRALIRQFVLVREADRMGYDDIWIGEHHFDGEWPTSAGTALLGHLAGVTSKARIGSAALVPGIRNPVQLAEDLATLDLLSKGRLKLGAAHGGPFPETLRQFGLSALSPAQQRERMLECLDLVHRLLAEDEVSHKGTNYQVDSVRIAPKPGQKPLPTWVASGDEATIAHAARAGWGLIAAATHTSTRIKQALATYRAAAPEGNPRLVLTRFGCPAATREEALAIAVPYLERFVAHAKQSSLASRGYAPDWSAAFSVEALLAQSLVGSYQEVADQMRALGEDPGADSIAIIPMSAQFDTHKHILADFVDQVRPLLDE